MFPGLLVRLFCTDSDKFLKNISHAHVIHVFKLL